MKWWANLCAALGLVPVAELKSARTARGNVVSSLMSQVADLESVVIYLREQLGSRWTEFEDRLAAKEQEIADLTGRLAALTTPNKRPFCLFCDKGVHRGGEPYTVHSVIHKGCVPPTAQEVVPMLETVFEPDDEIDDWRGTPLDEEETTC